MTSIVGQTSTVDCGADGEILCDLRGKLHRQLGLRLAVGDRVTVSRDEEADDARGMIEGVAERRTALRRPRQSKNDQVICANVDQVFIVVAAADPSYKTAFMDRVLVAAEREELRAVIVVNKIDLRSRTDERDDVECDLDVYRELGYEALCTSVKAREGLGKLKKLLADSVSVFTGPSGVGKSTLLNKLAPGFALRTGEVGKYGKGRHVTTSARLVGLPFGGFVVDTPGLRAFGISGLDPHELADYFRDMAPLLGACKFGDCRHMEEPKCAVLKALEEGTLDPGRYESYLRIRDELELEWEANRTHSRKKLN